MQWHSTLTAVSFVILGVISRCGRPVSVDVDGVGCRGRVALELRGHAQGSLPARLGGGLVGHAAALGVGVADFFAVRVIGCMCVCVRVSGCMGACAYPCVCGVCARVYMRAR